VHRVPAHEGSVEAANDPIDTLSQLRAVVLGSMALGQLVCLPIILERLVVLPQIVEVFTQCISQIDLVPQGQRLAQQVLHPPQPRTIGIPHLPVIHDAAVHGGIAGIECEHPLKGLLSFGELPTVGV